MKKLIAMIAATIALAACHPSAPTSVDCSKLTGPAAQSQCYGKISPQN